MRVDYLLCNQLVLNQLSVFLNENSDGITAEMVHNLMESTGYSALEAYRVLLAIFCDINFDETREDKFIYENYFMDLLQIVKKEDYEKDPYYQHIHFPIAKMGEWEMRLQSFKPYESFVLDDMVKDEQGKIQPKLAFFEEEFVYPAVLQNGREWMMVTPEEVETMKESIKKSHGKCITFGLGLGYYPYMVSLMDEVESITIVELDESVIKLFETFILPQFEHKEKVRVICADAYQYMDEQMKEEHYDFAYCDIWHDAADGVDLYLKFKEREKNFPDTEFDYWIEKTIQCYLD